MTEPLYDMKFHDTRDLETFSEIMNRLGLLAIRTVRSEFVNGWLFVHLWRYNSFFVDTEVIYVYRPIADEDLYRFRVSTIVSGGGLG